MNLLFKFILLANILANVSADTNVETVDVTCEPVECDYSEPGLLCCTIANVDYTSSNPSNLSLVNPDVSKNANVVKITGHYELMPLNLFELFPKLERLEISTGLKAITKENFVGGNQLKQLTLSGNKITTIAAHTFDGMGELRTLNLNDNKLTKIESHAFSGAINLITVDLHSNVVDTIEDGAFAGCTELKNVYLYMNELTRIGKSIDSVAKLSTVSFRNKKVKITDFDFYAIARKPHLVGFYASGVGLVLDDAALDADDIYAAEILDITENDLSYPNILHRLRNFKNLLNLHIGWNKFTAIDNIENIKEIFPKLETLVVNELPGKDEIFQRLQTKFGDKVKLSGPRIVFDNYTE